MRELEGTNVIHKSDNDFNPYVVSRIRDAKRADNVRDLIDRWGKAKTWEDIEMQGEIEGYDLKHETKEINQDITLDREDER